MSFRLPCRRMSTKNSWGVRDPCVWVVEGSISSKLQCGSLPGRRRTFTPSLVRGDFCSTPMMVPSRTGMSHIRTTIMPKGEMSPLPRGTTLRASSRRASSLAQPVSRKSFFHRNLGHRGGQHKPARCHARARFVASWYFPINPGNYPLTEIHILVTFYKIGDRFAFGLVTSGRQAICRARPGIVFLRRPSSVVSPQPRPQRRPHPRTASY